MVTNGGTTSALASGAPNNAQVATEWRAAVVSQHAWRRCESQAGGAPGEASGYYVTSATFPRRCYLKPGVDKGAEEGTHSRGAREKIASDLAHDLGLPVPPAVLAGDHDAPRRCTPAVLLVMYPVQWSWEQVKQHDVDETPKGAALAGIYSRCAPMFAFDTWVGQTDHGDHPSNIVWGYHQKRLSDSRVLFLDYANALGFSGSWNNDAWKNVAPAPWPPKLLEHLDRGELERAIERILGLPEDAVRQVVRRIPDDYMDPAQRALVAEALVQRRASLKQALAAHLGSTP